MWLDQIDKNSSFSLAYILIYLWLAQWIIIIRIPSLKNLTLHYVDDVYKICLYGNVLAHDIIS